MKSVKKNLWQKLKDRWILFYLRHKPVTRRQRILVYILSVSLIVFFYSAIQIGVRLFEYVRDDRNNDAIASLRSASASDPFGSIAPESESEVSSDSSDPEKPDVPYEIFQGTDTALNEGGRLPEYENLWQRNNDMIGWISIPGFTDKKISYPILYSGDNSYYLRRDFDGKKSTAGSIFLDGANTPLYENPLLPDYNYVLYGHAMRNKSMFGQLTDYFQNEWAWDNAATIYIDFLNTRLEYKVFSTFLVEPDYNYRQTIFRTEEEYKDYLDKLLTISTHDFGVTVGVKDRILTLSTCYQSTRRTGIVAKLVRQIIYKKGDGSQNPNVTPATLPTNMPTPAPSPTSAPSLQSSPESSSAPASSEISSGTASSEESSSSE